MQVAQPPTRQLLGKGMPSRRAAASSVSPGATVRRCPFTEAVCEVERAGVDMSASERVMVKILPREGEECEVIC